MSQSRQQPMLASKRSQALRRLGIVEWLPRSADLPPPGMERSTALVMETAATALAHAPERKSPAAPDLRPDAVSTPKSAPTPLSMDAMAEKPASRNLSNAAPQVTESKPLPYAAMATPVSAAAAAAPSLRGKLLRATTHASVLVLGLAEKNPRDALLHPDTAAGALLNAMLACLPSTVSVAVFGVERGEPLPVPASILVLGERAARALLGSEIAAPLRGRVHLFGHSRVVVSYHPDEVRQNASLKRLVWDDLRLLSALLLTTAPVAVANAEAN